MNGTTGAACVSIIVGPCAETPPKAHALLMFSIASLMEVAPFKYRYKRKRMHYYLQAIQLQHVNIISLMVYKIQILFWKTSQKLYHQWKFIHKVNISTEMSLVIQTYNIMTSIMVMHSLSKTNITKSVLVFT